MLSEYEESSSDGLSSLSDSEVDVGDGRIKSPRYPTFNMNTEMKNPKFKIGLRFKSAKNFGKINRMHSIVDNRGIRFAKNEAGRIRAKCSEECARRISGSLMHDRKTIQVKRLDEPYT